MSQHVNAIYEKGVLRPLAPLDLQEAQLVSLSIEKVIDNGSESGEDPSWTDVVTVGDPELTWGQVQSVLAKMPESLSEDFDRERDERF